MSRYYVGCGCGDEVVCVQWLDDDHTEVSLFTRHPARSLRNRIRLAWAALIGRPYADMVILDMASTRRLVKVLRGDDVE